MSEEADPYRTKSRYAIPDNESISIQEENPSHAWRTEIPNIVLDLKLSPWELALYIHLKRAAGDKGRCFKGTRRLAAEAGMSAGKVVDCKAELCRKRPELGDRSLIVVREAERNGCKYHEIVICDLWSANLNRFKKPSSSQATPVHEVNGGVHGMNGGVHEVNERRSQEEDHVKNNSKEHVEEVWKAYPRKDNKAQGVNRIKEALRSVPFETLLTKTRLYAKASASKETQYLPHASTWFHQRRYEDDPACWDAAFTNGVNKSNHVNIGKVNGVPPMRILDPNNPYA